jgi:hypothetical protein
MATGSARYQARISIDDRLGALWSHLESLPKRSRVAELIFLAQLGLVTRSAVRLDVRFEPAKPKVDAASTTSSREHDRLALTSMEDGVQALAAWGNAEMKFP